jgi:hypothetical protein
MKGTDNRYDPEILLRRTEIQDHGLCSVDTGTANEMKDPHDERESSSDIVRPVPAGKMGPQAMIQSIAKNVSERLFQCMVSAMNSGLRATHR